MATRLLGIESSCDETAAAVVDSSGRVDSNVVASQVSVHHAFGGVVPEIASRHHIRNIVPVVREALACARVGLGDLDGIAATAGPGLVGGLLVGLQFAKALAWAYRLPFVGVDHLLAHLEAPYLSLADEDEESREDPPFPHVALLASGGHTLVGIRRGPRSLQVLGATRDDAAGEAFDKVSKMLGLGYPGGPIVALMAADGNPERVHFPRAMLKRKGYDFSFSGLKTAVRHYLARQGSQPLDSDLRADVCASFQEAVVDVLVTRALQAIRSSQLQDLVVAGGVAANHRLRERLVEASREEGFRVHLPRLRFCTDNAAMVARAGLRRILAGERDGLDLNATATWRGP